jgi:hypothetical protein
MRKIAKFGHKYPIQGIKSACFVVDNRATDRPFGVLVQIESVLGAEPESFSENALGAEPEAFSFWANVILLNALHCAR